MDIKKIVFKNLDGSLRKVNIVNSINGIDIPDSGAVILDTVKDISADGSSLTVTKSDGSEVTLNTSGKVKTVNSVQPDDNGNIEIQTGTVKTVDGKAPDSDGDVALNAVKSINGNTPSANGNFELNAVSDITLSGKNLNIECTTGNTKTLILPFSDVKTVNNIQPDDNGNIEIPTGTVKSINNTSPDDNGNIALNCVESVCIESGMMAVTDQSGIQQYDLVTQYSSTEESTDESTNISVNTKTKYHSITLNTLNSSIEFVNPTQSEDGSESLDSEASTSPETPDVSSSAVINLQLFIKQGTGTNTVTWPDNVKWENGIEPVLSSEKDHVDLISLVSLDNGQNYYGFAKAVWNS